MKKNQAGEYCKVERIKYFSGCIFNTPFKLSACHQFTEFILHVMFTIVSLVSLHNP